MALEAPPIADWNALAASKREASMKKIPSAWELSSSLTSQFLPTSTLNVLDVPRTCGLLSERELQLTENYDATALIELMTTGQVKSLDVVKAFCKRAAIAQQCVSCLTEIMFEEAVARARECDEFLEREGRPIGPLHGLPVSLKVLFTYTSYPSSGHLI
jgi:amidase